MQQPKNLDEAIETLTLEYASELEAIAAIPEDDWSARAHPGLGRAVRNKWGLWWSEKSPYSKPLIVQYFNDLGIVHADDMSSIILTSFHRKVTGKPIDLEGQVQQCKQRRIEQGYPDGIPK